MSKDTTAWASWPSLKVGDKVTLPASEPTRWQRFVHWMRGTKPPTTVRCVVTHIVSSGEAKAEPL